MNIVKYQWFWLLQDVTPSPTEYQTHHTEPRVFSPAYKPFHSAADRFPVYRRDLEEITPG